MECSVFGLTGCEDAEKTKKLTGSAGLKYSLINNGAEYIVTGIGICSETEIIIPSTYNKISVTSIGESDFSNCTSLVSIIFNETKEQWGNISKSSYWHSDVPATVIHCTNGDVNI